MFYISVDSTSIDINAKISEETLQQLKDLGLFGQQIPEDYGMFPVNLLNIFGLKHFENDFCETKFWKLNQKLDICVWVIGTFHCPCKVKINFLSHVKFEKTS